MQLTNKKISGINAPPPNEPHSLIDEIFTWSLKNSTKEEILMRGKSAQHISTPKITGRTLLSPNGS